MRFHRSLLAVTVLAFGMLALAPAATAHHFLAGPIGVGDECYWVAKNGEVWITGYDYAAPYGPPGWRSCDPHDPCAEPYECPAPQRLI
ncbi:MAG TPA: hypothetical protein VM889_01315 [Candidatus Thermoplasmatota archaeon]|nr:hypothetical protein [Candidatus Thermoplasmatota archaeon]